jgi:hypothetical protein
MGIQTAPGYIALNSDGVTPYQHPVELDRNLNEAIFRQSGALRGGDWAITPTGTNQQVSIAQGFGFILGQESAQQGGYFAWSDAAETKTFGAPSGSPRIDTLLLRVYDSQYGTLPSGTGRVQWDIVAGTPGATPAVQPDSAFISTGGQWVPGAWMKWAEVRINPGDTVIPSGQIYLPGSVVSGTGTTWSQRYARQSGGLILCTSVSRPASPTLGDHIYETDTKRHNIWNGSAWLWPYARGVVGGTRYTGTGNLAATISTENISNMQSGTVALEANRSYLLKVRFKVTYVNSSVTNIVMRLRDGSLVGTQVAEWVFDAANSAAGHTFSCESDYDTTSAVSKNFVLTITSTGATSTINGPGTTNPTYVEIHDMGPSGIVNVQNTP